jgi:S1-C subfamily serine protease
MKTFNPCRRRVVMTVFAGVNLLLLAGEFAVSSARSATPPKTNIDDTPPPRDSHPTSSYAPIIKKVSLSVVNIYTSKTLAIGDPFGVGQTVTKGIDSAKDRGGIGITNYEDFIQTDASINPGNSGGALVDAEGRLVGINTAILSRTGGNQGIGFAVPVNLARYVMERIVVDGKVTRGYLGVKIQPLTPEIAKQSKLSQPSGALIAEGPVNNSFTASREERAR